MNSDNSLNQTFMFCCWAESSKLTLFFWSPFFSKNTTMCLSRLHAVDVTRLPDGLQYTDSN